MEARENSSPQTPFSKTVARKLHTTPHTLLQDSRFTTCEKNAFLTMHSFLVLFSFQFHEAPTMIGLKIVQTVDKHKFCEQNLWPYANH